jgi:hypothetical protein
MRQNPEEMQLLPNNNAATATNQPANNAQNQMSDIQLCRELAEMYDKNLKHNRSETTLTQRVFKGASGAGSLALAGGFVVAAGFLGGLIMIPFGIPTVMMGAYGANLLKSAIKPESEDKRTAYEQTLEDIVGERVSGIRASIWGLKENRDKENIKTLVKIGKGQKNEEKIEKIDRDFIEKAKDGLVKFKEKEENRRMGEEDERTIAKFKEVRENQRMGEEDERTIAKFKEAEENQINSHTTNYLEPAPQRTTTNPLNNPTNQSLESLSGKLERARSSSLGSSENQNQVH